MTSKVFICGVSWLSGRAGAPHMEFSVFSTAEWTASNMEPWAHGLSAFPLFLFKPLLNIMKLYFEYGHKDIATISF